MDNYPGLGFGTYVVPALLNDSLFDSVDTLNYVSGLDELSRNELRHASHEFQSREEMERYLYHLHQNEDYKGGA